MELAGAAEVLYTGAGSIEDAAAKYGRTTAHSCHPYGEPLLQL